MASLMVWGQQSTPGPGTTGQIEDAHRALDLAGIPPGPLAVRTLAAAGMIVRLLEHDHCDHDPIECSHQALAGEYRATVEQVERWERAAADCALDRRRLREALTFYATNSNWEPTLIAIVPAGQPNAGACTFEHPVVRSDRGRTARTALAMGVTADTSAAPATSADGAVTEAETGSAPV